MWDSERWDSARVNCGDNRHWPDWFDDPPDGEESVRSVNDGGGRGAPRLETAKSMGADHTFSMLDGQDAVVSSALAVTKERGFDVVIEAVGTPESFETAQALVGAGGTIASLGVFGESCELHLEKLWNRNICTLPKCPPCAGHY